MTNRSPCELAKGFSVPAKLYAQVSFNLMWITSTIGVARVDWRWAIVSFGIYAYGIPGVVMRHLACPRCPHLYVYGDCLQAPPRITKWLVKRRKTGPFEAWERWAFGIVFVLLPTFPLYWLRSQPVLLGTFISASLAWYVGQWFWFCKRCRVKSCPFNRAAGEVPG